MLIAGYDCQELMVQAQQAVAKAREALVPDPIVTNQMIWVITRIFTLLWIYQSLSKKTPGTKYGVLVGRENHLSMIDFPASHV